MTCEHIFKTPLEAVVQREDKLCDLHFLKVTLSMQHPQYKPDAGSSNIIIYKSDLFEIPADTGLDWWKKTFQHPSQQLRTSQPRASLFDVAQPQPQLQAEPQVAQPQPQLQHPDPQRNEDNTGWMCGYGCGYFSVERRDPGASRWIEHEVSLK